MSTRSFGVWVLGFLACGLALGGGQQLGLRPADVTLSLLALIALGCALPFRDQDPHLRSGVLAAAATWGFGMPVAITYISRNASNLLFSVGVALLGIAAFSLLLFVFSALTHWSVRGLKFTLEE